jgi:hypothetical protein
MSTRRVSGGHGRESDKSKRERQQTESVRALSTAELCRRAGQARDDTRVRDELVRRFPNFYFRDGFLEGRTERAYWRAPTADVEAAYPDRLIALPWRYGQLYLTAYDWPDAKPRTDEDRERLLANGWTIYRRVERHEYEVEAVAH